MDKIPSYKEFLELNESLVILSLDKMMKNEFMNNLELKQEYEKARRLFFDEGGSIFSHIEGPKFELRTFSDIEPSDMDGIVTKINEELSRFKFKRIGPPKKNILKESIWTLKAKLV
jgi:hypothetical protein